MSIDEFLKEVQEFLKEAQGKIVVSLFATAVLAIVKKTGKSLFGFTRQLFKTESRKSIESQNVMDILAFANMPMMVDTSTGRMIPDPAPYARRSHLLP